MSNFYTLLTDAGISAIVNARATGVEVKLSQMAVGDGEIIPSQDMTSLLSEKYRFDINSIKQDEDNPSHLIVEGVIPSDIGGFDISEVGIYTQDGTFFAIGSLPKTYKPLIEEGSTKDLIIRVIIEVGNADCVTLVADTNVSLATTEFVEDELNKHIEDKNNPHNVTKAQVGLGNVDNTADSTKNVLSATKLTTARTIGGVAFDGSSNINLPGVNTQGNQNTTGNAATATKLQTARTISLTGAVTGSANFDGSGNISISTTRAGGGSSVGSIGDILYVGVSSSYLHNLGGGDRTVTFNKGTTVSGASLGMASFKRHVVYAVEGISNGPTPSDVTSPVISDTALAGSWLLTETVSWEGEVGSLFGDAPEDLTVAYAIRIA